MSLFYNPMTKIPQFKNIIVHEDDDLIFINKPDHRSIELLRRSDAAVCLLENRWGKTHASRLKGL